MKEQSLKAKIRYQIKKLRYKHYTYTLPNFLPQEALDDFRDIIYQLFLKKK